MTRLPEPVSHGAGARDAGVHVSRRRLLGASTSAAVVAAAAGLAAGATGGAGPGQASPSAGPDAPIDFHGEHQAGIVTPAQDHLHFVALDVVTTDRAELAALLRTWTRAAERMTAGAEAAAGGLVGGGPHRPPEDTGEAYGLPASGLTITIGFGPLLFDDRFGLASRKPAALEELPPFAGDQLDSRRCGGDLCIQACANDPQVAVHAVRNLVRLGVGVVAVRWSQLGFGRTSSTSTSHTTPRNLFGFKDGTSNLQAEDPEALTRHVWVGRGDEAASGSWMVGGSYLVARRIRMHLEVWDRTSLQEQQEVIGRDKKEGAPLGRIREHDPPDFAAKGPDGDPVVPARSHVRLAHASRLGGIRLLRRGYTFTDGTDGVGHLDAGLFFLAFMRHPGRQFVPMQRALAGADLLNEYVEHTGSAVFACPPGTAPGRWWGEELFA
ncbi:MAG TPA: iron uptake transporter deferrochelatase/peroxidase subunit [Intrasporangium sp.]|uniref:iron uptake transporter deferrochelatase/peroxidase subunit n=1 Tax=Intrasporangium sp. TaxID=1925024 RepID=UPI002D782BEF|nr:iron uptake transporter deferrochelatase/peroxidase subunit [Intrasporangium sp.]HET7398277.1 iron uptake transporter deferrochelatase/peroxidase subunit [Intrasporangium sp.]